MGNANLHAARKAKNDEFYTRRSDIEEEMKHYKKRFRGKRVYCNCDDPDTSRFVEYFRERFDDLGLKSLTATGYMLKHFTSSANDFEFCSDFGGGWTINADGERPVETDGDCFSEINRAILAESDIVVTNPPFSLFRKYTEMLMEWGGKFCIIGDMNALTYKDVFPLFHDGKMWIGATLHNGAWFESVDVNGCSTKTIREVDGSMQRWNGRARWFTNMDYKRRHDPLVLRKRFRARDYPHYDNYDAIDVPLVASIPADWQGVMGVPITFLNKHCPEQFEIVGWTRNPKPQGDATINGEIVYRRILIRNRDPEPARKAA